MATTPTELTESARDFLASEFRRCQGEGPGGSPPWTADEVLIHAAVTIHLMGDDDGGGMEFLPVGPVDVGDYLN